MITSVLKQCAEAGSALDSVRGSSDSPPTEQALTSRPCAFIIDDEDVVCKAISLLVSSEGFEAECFPTAQLAFSALHRQTPEVIFLDIALKGSDAIDVIRKLGEDEYRGVVQLMSGSSQSLLEDIRCIGERHQLNMRPPLRKPFNAQAVREVTAAVRFTARSESEFASEPVHTASLDESLAKGWLELWYQPKLDFRTQSFVGAEGLIRCRHPAHGVLTPANFLPGASARSLALLTEYVVLTALRDWHDLSSIGFNLRLAVNGSIAALANMNLPALIRENRPSSEEWPGLILEITEGEVAQDVALAYEIATQLRIYGISIALDDFGEGYSSFARLRDFPFAELKLDASFVKNCASDKKNAGICRAVIELAHNFGAVAVAEGLENLSDVQVVRRMGCDLGQGFLFARPMPRGPFVSLLHDRAGQKPLSN